VAKDFIQVLGKSYKTFIGDSYKAIVEYLGK
jgi:hypothetical protein